MCVKNFITYPSFLCYQSYELELDTVAAVGKLPVYLGHIPSTTELDVSLKSSLWICGSSRARSHFSRRLILWPGFSCLGLQLWEWMGTREEGRLTQSPVYPAPYESRHEHPTALCAASFTADCGTRAENLIRGRWLMVRCFLSFGGMLPMNTWGKYMFLRLFVFLFIVFRCLWKLTHSSPFPVFFL